MITTPGRQSGGSSESHQGPIPSRPILGANGVRLDVPAKRSIFHLLKDSSRWPRMIAVVLGARRGSCSHHPERRRGWALASENTDRIDPKTSRMESFCKSDSKIRYPGHRRRLGLTLASGMWGSAREGGHQPAIPRPSRHGRRNGSTCQFIAEGGRGHNFERTGVCGVSILKPLEGCAPPFL